MQELEDSLNSKIEEVNNYLNFVNEKINRENKIVSYQYTKNLNEVLIANGYLMLYNAIEATVSQSINVIYSTIHASKHVYEEVTNHIKLKWIYDKLSKNSKNDRLLNIIHLINDNKFLELNDKNLGLLGNIDAKKIREILTLHGIPNFKLPAEDILIIIKEKRNELAHGGKSFSEASAGCSIAQMLHYATETFLFLKEFIKHVVQYIKNKDYLVKLESQTITNKINTEKV